jgi:hypothetical protein
MFSDAKIGRPIKSAAMACQAAKKVSLYQNPSCFSVCWLECNFTPRDFKKTIPEKEMMGILYLIHIKNLYAAAGLD